MKTFYLAVCLAITMIGSHYRTAAQIDKELAIEIIKSNLTNEELQNYNVLIFPDLIQSQDFYLSPYHVLHSEFDKSWIFFIDMYPLAQWDHNCKYIFLDQQTGNLTIIDYRIPPQDYWYGWEYVNTPYPYPVSNPIQGSNQGDSNTANPDPHKYAVFLCWKEWEPCRWNNLSHLYCGIKRNYGFMDENIFVLSGDGNYDSLSTYNLDNDTILNDFDDPCIKDSIENVFNYLSQTLTNEDILFVYATSHGEKRGQDTSFLRLWNYDSLFDYELAEMLDDIQCSEKIIGLDACYSGGFKENFEDSHTVLQTCVSADTISIIYNGFGFQDMSFWWGTALRGYYPYSKEYPYVNGPKIGENDSLYIISNIDSVDFNPDDTLGGNHDGFIQFQEAFNFAFRYASDIRDRGGQNYINEGFQGDLLTLNGIEGRVDTTQEISGNFLIGRKLTLAPGTILSDGSEPLYLYLSDSTEILVEDSAKLNINCYTGADIIGCSGESYINVYGDLRTANMDFIGKNGAKINLNFKNSDKPYSLTTFEFENVTITADCQTLRFDQSSFVNTAIDFSGSDSFILDLNTLESCNINFSGGELNFYNVNEFSNSIFDLSTGNIMIEDSNRFINSSIKISHPVDVAANLEISDNFFENDTTVLAISVITIEDYANFLIDGNKILYDNGRGIELFNAGWDGRGVQQIIGNSIDLSQPSTSLWSDLGIHSYCSKVEIRNNQIRRNNYGLVGFHNSDLEVLGDSTAEDYSETQLIGDNTRCQCLFNFASFPTEFHWNVIRDTIQYSNQNHPFIKTVDYDELMQDTTGATEWLIGPYLDVTKNCWVDSTGLDDRLIPLGAYIDSAIHCPGDGGGHLKTIDIPQSIYYQAKNDILDSNYLSAESEFKQVIAQYPESKYAIASLKGLFALNPALYDSNYSSLRNYCDSLALMPGDSLLGKTAEWFSIRCNIENENYQQAVNSLDSILANPGTYADSVFALIDLSEIYSEMGDSSDLKQSLVTNNPQVIPGSYKQFIAQRKEWIDLLLKSNDERPNDIFPPANDNFFNSTGEITSVFPNPFQQQFTFEIELLKEGILEISVVSTIGQQVLNLNYGRKSAGNYKETLSLPTVQNGILFLVLRLDGAIIDSEKILCN